jgi:hypothetical protein
MLRALWNVARSALETGGSQGIEVDRLARGCGVGRTGFQRCGRDAQLAHWLVRHGGIRSVGLWDECGCTMYDRRKGFIACKPSDSGPMTSIRSLFRWCGKSLSEVGFHDRGRDPRFAFPAFGAAAMGGFLGNGGGV